MKVTKYLLFSLTLLFALPAAPQNAAPNTAASALTAVPPLIPYSGVVGSVSGLQSPADASITFLIYKDEQGGEPLFSETQTVALDAAGHYKAQLGATLSNGIPVELFATGEARWLEVQIAGEMPQPRVLLASVPYALKAADAATLGGMPPSAFALAGTRSAANAVPSITPNLATDVTTTGGIAGYVPKFSGAGSVIDSPVFISGADVGIGTTTPAATLDVNGTALLSGLLTANGGATLVGSLELAPVGTATAATGYNSQYLKIFSSAYNSTSKAVVNPRFEWEALATGNNTAAPSATLNLLSSTTSAGATPTGFYFNANGTINFAPGQTLPAVTGNEAVTGILSASQLTSTAATGTAPLKVTSTTQVLNLNASLLGGLSASAFATHAANTFAGNQFIDGTGAAGNYGLTVNQPSQTGVLVESVLTGVGAGIDLQTTGSGGKDWEILATGSGAIQGPGKFNIRDINTGADVFTISSTDAVTVGGALTLQGNVTDSSTFITSSNVIGGWSGNTVTNSATGATIAGGGESTEAGGPNTVSADFGTVGGGENNTASAEASTVAGGFGNAASGFASTVAGGINTASGSTSTVPGGYSNLASGDISFAAGFVAHATDSGSFVWCQQNGSLCSSSGTNSFVVSVNGPIYFYDGPNGQGCYLSAGSGSWTCSSDRNLKDNIVSIDPRSVLDRVAQMPISQWSMKADSAGHKHIGPMAQDFYAAFGLGDTDKYIAQGDAQGVALASIQGLYRMVQEKLQQKDDEIHALQLQLQALEERIARK
jgi:hypothetical protein